MRKGYSKPSGGSSVAPAANAGGAIVVQPKLAIGAVNDPLEMEADAMADKVMNRQNLPSVDVVGSNNIQRKCAECEKEEEEESIQRKQLSSFIQGRESAGGAVASEAVNDQVNSTKGNGNSIDDSTRSFMENRFGADFNDIKIHTDGEAIQMSRDLNAKAFAVGNDIYFNEGQYQPQSSAGKHLLAHELTHTLQQSSAIQRQPQQQLTPGSHPEINIDPHSAEIIFTQAIRALGNIRVRGRLTEPLNLAEDVTGVSIRLPPSTLDLSLSYDDRCNRALQGFFARVQQQQAAGQRVFDFSQADWSVSAGAGFRIGGLRVDASGQGSFHGDQFQALSFALTFTPGVSQAIPDECRRRPPSGDKDNDQGHRGDDGGNGTINPCDGIDCTRPATVRNFILHRLCCLIPPGTTTTTTATPELTGRTIYFYYDTPVFKATSNDSLAQIFDIMRMLPSVHIQITGHTSREGTDVHNDSLSRRRAEAVRDYLLLNGIDSSRIHLLWMGEHAPAVAEPPEPARRSLRLPADEAIRDMNRRAEVIFFDPSGKLDFLPASAPMILSAPDLSLSLPRRSPGSSFLQSPHLSWSTDEQ